MAGRPRKYENDTNADRLRRSREALRAKGGRHVSVKIEPEHMAILTRYKEENKCSDTETIRHFLEIAFVSAGLK